MNRNKHEKTQRVKWYLYILVCADGSYYTGITTNLTRRVEMHNSGTAARYTKSRRPVKLVYSEICENRSDALKKEYAIKQLSRKEKEECLNHQAVLRI